jgi:4-hydroxy-tetrahydrodipicolinate reductase
MPIRVMLMGLGPIGAAVARQAADRKALKIVGAVDIDPEKVGRDVGEVIGLARKLRVKVTDDPAATLRAVRPDVAVLCTSSSLRKVLPQFETVLKARVPIVSTTEELAYPWFSNRALARKLDALATKARVAVVGTGVNPGFAMDALPIMLSGICERVDSVRVDRVQDARIRRLPFQKKIGAGMTADEFARNVEDKTVRHVGLTESIAMIGDALGWQLDRITDEIVPKIAERPVASEFLTVTQGLVCGLVQDGIGYRGGKPVIVLHMEAYLGAPETYDAVTIEGSPRLSVKAAGGFHGDIATASITVNSIPKVLQASPGLHTMRSLPIPSFFGSTTARAPRADGRRSRRA